MPLTVSEIRNLLLLPGHGAHVQLSLGFCCEHNCFSSTHARAQWQCLSTSRDILHVYLSGHWVPVRTRFLLLPNIQKQIGANKYTVTNGVITHTTLYTYLGISYWASFINSPL